MKYVEEEAPIRRRKRKQKKYHANHESNKEDAIESYGVVTESNHDIFRVQLIDEDTGEKQSHYVLCQPSGKLRKNHIRILVGDYVDLEISPYDLDRGRITFRRSKD